MDQDQDQRPERRDSPDADDASSWPPDSTEPSSTQDPAASERAEDAAPAEREPGAEPSAESDETTTWPAPSGPDAGASHDEPQPATPASADEAASPDDGGWGRADQGAPDEPAPPDAVTGSEMESWPTRDAASPSWSTEPPEAGSGQGETWPTAPPDAGTGEGDTWPTAPPDAGSAAADTWPTEAPGRGDQESWAEPPPSEVEAYPAGPAAADDAAVAGGAAGATAGMAAGTAAHSVPAAESATAESTKCPRCGTENLPGLAFCRSCGQRLVAAGVASTVERPGAPEGTMACPRCGTHNRAGVAFCQNCGANLRGTAAGYVPPAVATEAAAAPATATEGGGAVLGPVVLLIGLAGIVTGYLLPFPYGSGSLFDRAMGPGGYGISFWAGYPEVGAALEHQAYFGLAGPAPILGVLLLLLAIAGFVRARPGLLQTLGLGIALLWSVGLIILFVVVELAGNWSGDLVGVLRDLSAGGIIFFLASLIIVIGTLTRFGRS